MCKKMIYLISLVFVLSMAANASADLILHWPFDEGSGNVAGDRSGNGRDGTIEGNPAWAAGQIGGALEFSGGSHVIDDDAASYMNGLSAFSIALWIKSNVVGTDSGFIIFEEPEGQDKKNIRYDSDGGEGDINLIKYGVTTGADVREEDESPSDIQTTEWQHVCVTWLSGSGTFPEGLNLYVNGELLTPEEDDDDFTPNGVTSAYDRVMVGKGGKDEGANESWDGLIDDVRIYDHVLSVEEIQAVMIGGEGYPYALGPDPADGALYDNYYATPRWTAGDFAVTHDVYFGDNFDDVNDGAGDTFIKSLSVGTEYFLVGFPNTPIPDGLVPGTTYYWRIDEVNDAEPNSPWKGQVWSFTVPTNKAHYPVPGDGAKFIIPESVELSWTAGLGAILHNVYFGEDLETVTNATGALPQPNATFSPPGPLELEKTYYWRVDEFDVAAATHKGDVWSFTTMPDIPITNPNLVGWWKLDAGDGTVAVDFSGHGNHGTIRGSTFWIDGYDLGALEFTGPGDFVEMNGYEGITGANSRTMTAWVKTTTPNRTILTWGVNTTGQKWRMRSDATSGLRVEVNGGYHYGVTSIADGQWHHVAVTFEDDGTPDVLDTVLYVDGQLDATAESLDEPIDTSATGVVRIGESPWHNAPFVGLIDDVRIYDKALTLQEIHLVMRIDTLLAWQPSPTNGSTSNIDDATPLSWTSGDMASQHDVYFGTDEDAVTNADASDTTGIYRGSQGGVSYTPTEGVEWGGGPYYWRIDENNTDSTVTKGRVWSFTVADFTLIEDFEAYNVGDNEVWYSWHDGLGAGAVGLPGYVPGNGTGSAVGDDFSPSYMEETIVHGGGKSLPFFFNNNKQGFNKYSEAELTLTDERDWTKGGVEELSLWFRGNPASVGSFVEGPVGTYTMTASGADIWTDADEFHYAYRTLTGAGSIIARVESVELANNWSKAGVMIRETLDAGSKFAAVYITPTDADGTATNGCTFQARLDTDIDAVSDGDVRTPEQLAIIAPYWIKIERDVVGNFSAYYSTDGSSWRSMFWNPQNISMNANVYIGLALTSHDDALTCQAVFSNVSTSASVGAQWANQDIGIESNAAEPLYVAVSNTTGLPAVLYHTDPGAANVETWTEWPIPLQDLVDQGLNLADVDRIAIGIGTRGNTTIPGGLGKMYFDDVRLYQSREVVEP